LASKGGRREALPEDFARRQRPGAADLDVHGVAVHHLAAKALLITNAAVWVLTDTALR
jgi:hypothetical protein